MKKDSWLQSESFLKRAFAIWGYHFVANILIMIPFLILWSLLAATFFGAMMRSGMMPPEGGAMMEYDGGL
jgi:hypothetical protein